MNDELGNRDRRQVLAMRLALVAALALALNACESHSRSSAGTKPLPVVMETSIVSYPGPQDSPYDTPITPMETVGAAAGE
jgi:hypothetical protein